MDQASVSGAGQSGQSRVVSACFVTPSFAPDFERCRLLVESREFLAPQIDHFIVVDRHDLDLFSGLRSATTHVLDSRALMGSGFVKLPGKGIWLSMRTPPVRGWISQQIRKLAIAETLDADVIVNVDSDVVLVNPVTVDHFFRGADLSLFEIDFRDESVRTWDRVAQQLLGLGDQGEPNGHVGQMVPWWRRNVLALLARIEEVSGLDWRIAIARHRTFSEYQIYGRFCTSLPELAPGPHFPDDRELVRTTWRYPVTDEASLKALFDGAGGDTLGVMVHSKDGIDPATYRAHAARVWESHGTAALRPPPRPR